MIASKSLSLLLFANLPSKAAKYPMMMFLAP